MQTLFYLAGNALRIYALYIFIGVFLQKKDLSKWAFFFAYVAFYAINSAAYLFINIPLLTFSTNIIPSFIITFMYKAKTWKRAFVTLLTYGIYGSWEIIVYCIYVMLNIQGGIIHEFLAPTIFFIASMFIRFFVKQRLQVPSAIKTIYFIMLAFIVIGSVVIGYLTMFEADIKSLAIATILLLLNFFVFYMFDQIIKSYVNQRELDLQIKQNEILKLQEQYSRQYVKDADLQYDSIRKIRHDMKNQLSVVFAMLAENRIDSAMEYISKNVDVISSKHNIVNTNSIVVNAIVNSKFTVAETVGIKVQFSSVKGFDGIDEMDICHLLSNTLDNAIEACMNIPDEREKFVSLDISFENGIYQFVVKNSIKASVLENNSRLATSKIDKDLHGFGVGIIKEIAEKYQGRCEFFEEENVFCCLAALKAK